MVGGAQKDPDTACAQVVNTSWAMIQENICEEGKAFVGVMIQALKYQWEIACKDSRIV